MTKEIGALNTKTLDVLLVLTEKVIMTDWVQLCHVLFPVTFSILHTHGGPFTLHIKLPVLCCCSFSFAYSISFSLCLTVRSCFIATFLNGLSASLTLFKLHISLISLIPHLLLSVVVFHCSVLFFPVLFLYWLYQSYKYFCTVQSSSECLLVPVIVDHGLSSLS